MIKRFFVVTFFFLSAVTSFGQESKIISDCTVLYTVEVQDEKNGLSSSKAMDGTTKIVYIKGTLSRIDLNTPRFKQTTLHNTKTDSTVVLREIGSNKYISFLNENKRKEQNKRYEGIEFTNTTDKKVILGYECVKVIAKLVDGSTFNVYYTKAIIPVNKQFEYQFKDLPGLVLEYEAQSEDGKAKIKYSANKISLTPQAAAKFDVPKSGYRVL